MALVVGVTQLDSNLLTKKQIPRKYRRLFSLCTSFEHNLQVAIKKIENGGFILIFGGVYKIEELMITKDIKLIGINIDNKSKVTINSNGNAIILCRGQLENLLIKSNGTCILVKNQPNIIKNCQLYSSAITNCNIMKNSNIIIKNSLIEGGSYGIQVSNNNTAKFYKNQIKNCVLGIILLPNVKILEKWTKHCTH
eukprot:gb/GECH01007354.1/.p1 GENE.gb/GECH01007354.1/~~gb/GECH01007354.1/.p1  ORF type:complete len:195 (+),score=25.59 gb/GECH01007354.1/:1-585(+)